MPPTRPTPAWVTFSERVLASLLLGSPAWGAAQPHWQHLPGLGAGLAPLVDAGAPALPAQRSGPGWVLNGQTSRLTRADVVGAFRQAGVPARVVTNLWAHYARLRPVWQGLVARSFLPPALQQAYQDRLTRRAAQLLGT